MRVLVVTCECGERMRAPAWALGRLGACSSCKTKFRVSADNTEGVQVRQSRRGRTEASWDACQDLATSRSSHESKPPSPEAKERFARAADLYFEKKHARALAIFLSLAEEIPHSPEIEQARGLCLKALQAPPPLLPAPDRARETDLARVSGVDFDRTTVKRLILDKMLNSPSELVQLRAAELASRLVGLSVAGRSSAISVDELEVDSPAKGRTSPSGAGPSGKTYPSVIEL